MATKASLWQMPQASTLMRTSRGPGSGIGRSTSSNGAFGSAILHDAHGGISFGAGTQPKIWASLRPLKIDCTASAASRTPNTRTITFRAVTPIQLMDLLGGQKQHERDRHHREDRRDHRAEQR